MNRKNNANPLSSRENGYYPLGDYVYYNLTIYNDTNNYIQANFNEELTIPLLDDPNNYLVAVDQMSFSTHTIPIFNFYEKKDNGDYRYYVCLVYKNGLITEYYNAPILLIPFSNVPNDKSIYSVESFLYMVTSALNTAFLALDIAHPGFVNEAPEIVYDSSSGLIYIEANGLNYNWDLDPHVEICFNTELFSFFNSFPQYFYGINQPNKNDVAVIINPYFTALSGTTYTLSQEFPTVSSWYDVLNFILQANTFGVNTALFQGKSLSGVPDYKPVIASFVPEVSTPIPDYFSNVIYNPNYQHFYELTDTNPLKKIGLNFGYIDTKFNYNKILLSPGEYASCVLVFVKKNKNI